MNLFRRFARIIGVPGLVLSVSLMVVVAFAAFIYRGWVDNQDIIDSRDLVLQSRAQVGELNARLADQTSQLRALQAKLESVQAALDAIIPSRNTYNFSPNQSMILAEGRLTVGLVGPPTNERVNVNINGKQHSARVTSSTSRLIRLRHVGCKCKGLTCFGLRSMHHARHRSLSDGCPCKLFALSGHDLLHRTYLLSGVKRTWRSTRCHLNRLKLDHRGQGGCPLRRFFVSPGGGAWRCCCGAYCSR